MLGPSEAIAGLVDLLGTTTLSAKHGARILREAHRDYWPEIGSGHRGKVKLYHLVNFWLSTALSGSQPSNAPQVLDLLWGMLKHTPDETVYFKAVFLGIVRNVVRLVKSKRTVTGLDVAQVRFVLGTARFPTRVSVHWPQLGTEETARVEVFTSFSELREVLVRSKDSIPAGNKLYSTEVIIYGEDFVTFARLACKAEDDDLTAPSNAPPGSDAEDNTIPETTKPAGAGTRDGLQTEQPAIEKQTAPVNKAQSATRKARKQRLRELVEFRLQVPFPPPIERTGQHGAHWTDAAPP